MVLAFKTASISFPTHNDGCRQLHAGPPALFKAIKAGGVAATGSCDSM